jgi:CDP-paratose 2-epimerase
VRYLITGGCGFLGSNLAQECLRRGHELFIIDNLSREGTPKNQEWLETLGNYKFYRQDIRHSTEVERIVADVRPDVIFHLAGQVAMTTSLANPRLDFETNVIGGHNLLEAVRKHAPEAIVTYSSTNKVYGDLEYVKYEEGPTRYTAAGYPRGFDETTRLEFHSPYGCSKGATDQYMLDYARLFGLRTVVFRHSTIFGGRQFSTFDQGWVGWFVQKALEAKANSGSARALEDFTISGTGKQVRDVLYASDLVACYFGAVERIDRTAGQAFNMGGGMGNSLSLLELFAFLEKELQIELRYRQLPWRASDQKVFVADTGKAREYFGFEAKVDLWTGIRRMMDWVGQDG